MLDFTVFHLPSGCLLWHGPAGDTLWAVHFRLLCSSCLSVVSRLSRLFVLAGQRERSPELCNLHPCHINYHASNLMWEQNSSCFVNRPRFMTDVMGYTPCIVNLFSAARLAHWGGTNFSKMQISVLWCYQPANQTKLHSSHLFSSSSNAVWTLQPSLYFLQRKKSREPTWPRQLLLFKPLATPASESFLPALTGWKGLLPSLAASILSVSHSAPWGMKTDN